MAPHNDRRRQGVWSHWVPLAVTLTIATVGVAAWALSQRQHEHDDQEEEHEPGLDYENADYGDNPPYGATSRAATNNKQRPAGNPDGESYGTTAGHAETSAASWGTRMSGALRRTPSPQQFFDSTGKTITAGVAAAGAVMGKALASIREDDRYPADANPWSEEADARKTRGAATTHGKRRTVVLVVSADTQMTGHDEGSAHEHASILSHIPSNIDFSKVKLFVLIYAPGLKDADTDGNTTHTPGSEARSPTLTASTSNAAYNAIYSQALALVEKETMIMPFTTPNGHTYMLRPLQPDTVYLQQSLSGDNGALVTSLQTWFRHDIILVVGAEEGSGGLADSESEAERSKKAIEWWQRPERVGRGRGVVVVDSMRVHDDWVRRIEGQE
ncbi:hypothetical protein VHEMI05715 [[Torrubiella] hemipterigena]|uniref:Peroxin 22-like protein n=1 Tax=[Torrubiella] hemipterigena TaxID=1531966 RepID=A0A0A1THB5_9HYPO|nr:hypothetical protein VHEMI05715 [[Torrubiella] hemipterigena]